MSRSHQLRSALDRCRDRVTYCQREFTRFYSSADLAESEAQRQHRKLKADWERALKDCQWAQEQLDRVREVAGMDR